MHFISSTHFHQSHVFIFILPLPLGTFISPSVFCLLYCLVLHKCTNATVSFSFYFHFIEYALLLYLHFSVVDVKWIFSNSVFVFLFPIHLLCTSLNSTKSACATLLLRFCKQLKDFTNSLNVECAHHFASLHRDCHAFDPAVSRFRVAGRLSSYYFNSLCCILYSVGLACIPNRAGFMLCMLCHIQPVLTHLPDSPIQPSWPFPNVLIPLSKCFDVLPFPFQNFKILM